MYDSFLFLLKTNDIGRLIQCGSTSSGEHNTNRRSWASEGAHPLEEVVSLRKS